MTLQQYLECILSLLFVTLFSNKEKVAVVVSIICIEVKCSDAMLALCFFTLLVKCLMKRHGMSALG